jgi:hypothetical protein
MQVGHAVGRNAHCQRGQLVKADHAFETLHDNEAVPDNEFGIPRLFVTAGLLRVLRRLPRVTGEMLFFRCRVYPKG